MSNDDEIRRIYADEREATPAEAAAGLAEVLRNPAEARKLVEVLYALAPTDRDFARLIRSVEVGFQARRGRVRQLIARDDAAALRAAALIVTGMEVIRPGSIAALLGPDVTPSA